MKTRLLALPLLLLALNTHSSAAPTPLRGPLLPEPPKLILLIMIDQFRADFLTRFESRFLPVKQKNGQLGGFRYLMSQGAYFPYAQYDILQSMTGPGHATILSGSYPYLAGIPTNVWPDQTTGEDTYCVTDKTAQPVGGSARSGLSPRNFVGSTLGDELKNAGHPSKVVTIALKDRAAILMGGHRADLALWLDSKALQWSTSTFYAKNGQLPEWLNEPNKKLKMRQGEKVIWAVSGKPTGLSSPDAVDALTPSPAMGKTFPHELTFGNRESFASPVGLEVLAQVTEDALDGERLGKGAATDLLAISFSAHDYVGHLFGPNSLEMEEMTVAEDKVIAQLLNAVSKKIPGGLANVLVVLSADHGVVSSPLWLASHGVPAGLIDETKLTDKINTALTRELGKSSSGNWIIAGGDLNFFINRKAINAEHLPLSAVENLVKPILAQEPGMAWVFTGSEVRERRLPPGMHERQILHTYFPGRSGDIVGIPKPFFTPFEEGSSSVHMTGYTYDRTVPLILSGRYLKAGTYASRAEIVDLAPTLAFLTNVLAPAQSEGRVLHEAIRFEGKAPAP